MDAPTHSKKVTAYTVIRVSRSCGSVFCITEQLVVASKSYLLSPEKSKKQTRSRKKYIKVYCTNCNTSALINVPTSISKIIYFALPTSVFHQFYKKNNIISVCSSRGIFSKCS